MALVTGSFCERCGTRYEFQAPSPKALSVKGARVLAKGLRNFVLNDGQSFNDSLVLARSEDEAQDSSRLTEAFHQAFNFCMTCRQYACEKCWNLKAGACLTCAPLAAAAPVAPDTHLMVRTPVTRIEGSLLPGGPPSALGGLLSPAGSAPFSSGSLASEPLGEDQPEAPLWPEADLTTPESSMPRTPEWLLRRGSIDGETGPEQQNRSSLWPMADSLAPEATLTPEEMSLVAAQLASKPELDSPDEIDAAVPEAVADTVAEPLRAAEPEPSAERLPATEPAFDLFAEWHTPVVGEAPQAARLEAAQPQGAVEPMAAPAPAAEAPAPPTSLASRLLGLGARKNEQPTQPGKMAPRGQPSDAMWPHVTPWLERPARSYAPIFEDAQVDLAAEVELTANAAAEVATPALPAPIEVVRAAQMPVTAPDAQPAAEPTPEPAPEITVAAVAEEPSPAEPVAAAPLPVEPQPVVAREIPFSRAWQQRVLAEQAAAAVAAPPMPALPAEPAAVQPAAVPPVQAQLAAVESAAVEPAAPTPAPEPLAVPAPTVPVYPEQQTRGWPPLGAQYPAPVAQGPVWPAPAGVAAPAAILSTQAARSEMWAQSSQEVMNRGTVRVCLHCSLPLSTQARFCRRCGTSQS